MPPNAAVGKISVKVTASDGTATVSDTFDLTVNNVNDKPIFTSNAVTTATEDSVYTYKATATMSIKEIVLR